MKGYSTNRPVKRKALQSTSPKLVRRRSGMQGRESMDRVMNELWSVQPMSFRASPRWMGHGLGQGSPGESKALHKAAALGAGLVMPFKNRNFEEILGGIGFDAPSKDIR